jgi:hypothetical protein
VPAYRLVLAVFLLLLVFVAMFAGLARRLKVPYPILLVIAGVAWYLNLTISEMALVYCTYVALYLTCRQDVVCFQ